LHKFGGIDVREFLGRIRFGLGDLDVFSAFFELEHFGEKVGVARVAACVEDGAATQNQTNRLLTAFITAYGENHAGLV
jgi:hypothetical protein